MRQIRAKFRCMKVIHEWNDFNTVELRPVVQKGSNPENEKFWSATPSGEAKLVFSGPVLDNRCEPYEPGDYYYIDMVAAPTAGDWVLGVVTKRTCGGEVEFYTNARSTAGHDEKGFRHGSLQMGFNDNGIIELFGEAGVDWNVGFRWAEKSDD